MGAFARDACGQPLRATDEGQGQAGMFLGHLWTFRRAQDPFSLALRLWEQIGLGLGDRAAAFGSLYALFLPLAR
jgi:hypothetical protein